MKISISDKIRISMSDLPDSVIEELGKKFVHKNPTFGQNAKLKISNYNTPEFFNLCQQDGEFMTFPRGCLEQVCKVLSKHKIEHKIDEQYNDVVKTNFKANIILKPLQKEMLEAMLQVDNGIYCAPCGSGKTVTGLALIEARNCRTLILVHTKELLEQWVERIQQFFSMDKKDIGIIGDNKFSVKPLTVGLMQTVVGKVEEIKHSFDLIANDETHHVPCQTLMSIVDNMPCKYKYGTTATPKRKDKKEFLLFALIGNIVYQAEAEQGSLTPNCYLVPTQFDFPYYYQKEDEKEVFYCSKHRIVHDFIKSFLAAMIPDVALGKNTYIWQIFIIVYDKFKIIIYIIAHIVNFYDMRIFW